MAQREITGGRNAADEVEEGDETVENREARGFCLGYLSSRDKSDPVSSFTPEVHNGLKEEKERGGTVEEVDFAAKQGAKMGRFGDLLHVEAKEAVKKNAEMLVQMSREDTLKNFKRIVKKMFENEQGKTELNAGRLMVLFEFCYQLCVAYVKKETGYDVRGVVSFIIGVTSCLLMEFVRYKVIEWLKDRGGWDWLVKYVEVRGKHMLLIVGVAALSLCVMSYFWS